MKWLVRSIWLFGLFSAAAVAHSPHDDVFDVAFSPDFQQDGRLYAIVRSVVLVSDDGGATWARKVNGLDHKHMLVSLDVADGGRTVYVTSMGDGVYRSGDGGETWVHSNDGLESLVIDLVSASPHESGHAAVADVEGGLYITEDFAATWEKADGNYGKVTAVTFVPDQPGVLLMGDHHGGLYRSQNGGRHWDEVGRVAGSGAVTALAVAPAFTSDPVVLVGTATGRILRSDDGGESFESIVVSSAGQPIVSLAMSPQFANDRIAFASVWNEGVYFSDDGGHEWEARNHGLTRDRQATLLGRPDFSHLRLSPGFGVDRTVFLAGFDGLFQSRNGGSSWKQSHTLSPMNIVALSVSPDYREDHTLALTTWLWGTFLSNDGGNTWRAKNHGVSEPYVRNEGLVRLFNVAFSPHYASDGVLFTSTWYDLYKSTDQGSKWTRLPHIEVPKEAGKHRASSFAVSPNLKDDGTVFAGTKTGLILRSTNEGKSFKTLKDLANMIGSIAVTPSFARDATVFVGDTRGIHVSRDAGESWTFHRLNGSALYFEMPVSPAYPKEASAAWKDHVLSQREKAYAVKIAVSPAYARDATLFAGTADGLRRSRDGGRSWHRLAGFGFDEHAYIETVAVSPDFEHDDTLMVSVRGRGLFRSRDGGDSFSEIGAALKEGNKIPAHYVGMVPKFPSLVFSPDYASDGTVFGFSGTDLLQSQDEGDTWKTMPTPSVGVVARVRVWQRYWLERLHGVSRKQVFLGGVVVLLVATGGLFRMKKRISRRIQR